ncbi:hypothetical protein K402DRAFT_467555 [Aulographum hederae CBS 113979]|uniref:Uncharacterized protein n=1 Tax=Aulographum hederae CBS 113979 TaxID=1176131 RepID=A0A6G1GKJ2_9PEZI|nr:hypothetical protein K402DRAFT_467555 [Aulographum hederae CBS 113979]
MTKRKSAEELARNKATRKKLPFTAAKTAAQRSLIIQNSEKSPLFRLPQELRDEIWALVIGNVTLHVEFEEDPGLSDLMAALKKTDYDAPEFGWSTMVCQCRYSHQSLFEAWKQPDGSCSTIRKKDILLPHEVCYDDLPWIPSDPKSMKRKLGRTLDVQLFRVSRQVYTEVAPIFWSNTFSFVNGKTLRTFVEARTPPQRRLLRSIHLQTEMSSWPRPFPVSVIKSLVGLQELHLVLVQDMCTSIGELEGRQRFILSGLSSLTNFKLLPLKTVTVIVHDHSEIYGTASDSDSEDNDPSQSEQSLPNVPAKCLGFAQTIRDTILDAEGPARYREEQDFYKERAVEMKQLEKQNKAQKTCTMFSTEAECAAFHQRRQDAKDARDGRQRKMPKAAESCGAQHTCRICRQKPRGASTYRDARLCTRPGKCDQPLAEGE